MNDLNNFDIVISINEGRKKIYLYIYIYIKYKSFKYNIINIFMIFNYKK